jgi:hypothetical protein
MSALTELITRRSPWLTDILVQEGRRTVPCQIFEVIDGMVPSETCYKDIPLCWLDRSLAQFRWVSKGAFAGQVYDARHG